MKALAIFLIVLSVLGLFLAVWYSLHLNKSENLNDKEVYQGPVPKGYNEDHFRATGKTIPLEN